MFEIRRKRSLLFIFFLPIFRFRECELKKIYILLKIAKFILEIPK